MNKKLTVFLLLPIIILTGCSGPISQQKQIDNKSLSDKDLVTMMNEVEEGRLKPICDQKMIPAEYASDCFFRDLKDCESLSGKMIPKSDLKKCLPVFLRDQIDEIPNNLSENIQTDNILNN